MRPLRARIEGGVLALTGLLMLLLAAGDTYTRFMNPRYRWLTLAAAAALLVAGSALAARPSHGGRPSRLLAFGPLVALLGTVLVTGGATTTPSVITAPPAAANPAAVPINTGELYLVANGANPGDLARSYAARGIVRRTAELDGEEQFVLLRIYVYCCAADATAVGFRVSWGLSAMPQDGQWVRVEGQLVPYEGSADLSDIVRLPDAYFSAVHPRYALKAERVFPIDPPEVSFFFQLEQAEPYAY